MLQEDLERALNVLRRVYVFCERSIITDFWEVFRLRHVLRRGIIMPIIARFLDNKRKKTIPPQVIDAMVEIGDVNAVNEHFWHLRERLSIKLQRVRTEEYRRVLALQYRRLRQEHYTTRFLVKVNAEKHRY